MSIFYVSERACVVYSTFILAILQITYRTHNLKRLIEKTELFLRRSRWKAHHYLNPTDLLQKEKFGFKTTRFPPAVKELSEFEDKMLELIQNVKFKNNIKDFQRKLSQDSQKIKKDEKLWIAADKTTNFYPVDSAAYKQLAQKSITKSYKKAPSSTLSDIVTTEKQITGSLDLDDRIDAFAEKEAFVTYKDRKPNFTNNPSCRPINPANSLPTETVEAADIGAFKRNLRLHLGI